MPAIVRGRLPLHIALYVAMPASVLRLLIQPHLTSLLHATDETMETPLNMAIEFSIRHTIANIGHYKNLLVQAYVTSHFCGVATHAQGGRRIWTIPSALC